MFLYYRFCCKNKKGYSEEFQIFIQDALGFLKSDDLCGFAVSSDGWENWKLQTSQREICFDLIMGQGESLHNMHICSQKNRNWL